jgi:hypothetical protein
VCYEHRGVIVLHRGQIPNSNFQQSLEQGGYAKEGLTKAVAACIMREVREHLEAQGLEVVSLDLGTGDIEYEFDFFGIRLQDFLKVSYFAKSRWETVKLNECRNPIENGDQELPDLAVSDPNQLALFRA